MHFAQVGPPRNVTVEQTDVGDEFVVSWLPPEYGLETLRVYVVKWYREPGHFLTGTAETRENYYKGILTILTIITSLTHYTFINCVSSCIQHYSEISNGA